MTTTNYQLTEICPWPWPWSFFLSFLQERMECVLRFAFGNHEGFRYALKVWYGVVLCHSGGGTLPQFSTTILMAQSYLSPTHCLMNTSSCLTRFLSFPTLPYSTLPPQECLRTFSEPPLPFGPVLYITPLPNEHLLSVATLLYPLQSAFEHFLNLQQNRPAKLLADFVDRKVRPTHPSILSIVLI